MKRVFLFKEKKEKKDDYNDECTSREYTPIFIPVLDHDIVSTVILKELFARGPSAEKISGLILTSQRSVEAISKASSNIEESIVQEWKRLPTFIVGPQTAKALCNTLLFEHKNIPEHWMVAPNAATLVGPMLEKVKLPGPSSLLFLAGDKRRDLIPETLNEHAIRYREIQSYATCGHADLSKQINDVESHTSDWFVFFSPSGIKFILSDKNVRTNFIKMIRSAKVAAIGPTTEDYLKELEVNVNVTAEKPDAMHLFQAIERYDQSIQ
ncbi:tetrapyrrole biosynthesis, uroporphyrinogen III synthase [Backusella circina FSU 941]|nr:tetrapyrrole biosynthesis, uroporphyrinogen III synthase [Backusella circina FSU 941]